MTLFYIIVQLFSYFGENKSGSLIHLGQNQKSAMFAFWYYKFKMSISHASRDVDSMISWVKDFVGSQHVQSIVLVSLELAANTLVADR